MRIEALLESPLGAVYRQFRYRPRLLAAIVIGIVAWFVQPPEWRAPTRALIAWNFGAVLYLALFFRMAYRSAPDRIRQRAKVQDDGAVATLVLSLVAASMCFVAVAFELAGIKDINGPIKIYHLLLAAGTIPTAWFFIHTMFALHYAHEYYDAKDNKGHGLDFPGDTRPVYWDFIYFSYIIGTSGQTADVGISGAAMRKIATIHCTFAFFFNLSTLGLSVNVASSLL